MNSAFHIQTRLRDSLPEQNGFHRAFIVYDAPSVADAEQFARSHIKRTTMPPESPELKVNLAIIPVEERLITRFGEIPIDWPMLTLEAHDSPEFLHGAHAAFSYEASKTPIMEPEDLETIAKQLPPVFNWDPEKFSYFVARRDDCALIVQAMNLVMVSAPYCNAVAGMPDHAVQVDAWPGAIRYSADSE